MLLSWSLSHKCIWAGLLLLVITSVLSVKRQPSFAREFAAHVLASAIMRQQKRDALDRTQTGSSFTPYANTLLSSTGVNAFFPPVASTTLLLPDPARYSSTALSAVPQPTLFENLSPFHV